MPSALLSVFDLASRCWAAGLRSVHPLASAGSRFHALSGLRMRSRGAIPVRTQFDGAIRCRRGSHVALGDQCRLGHEVYFETNGDGRIEIGRNVRINRGSVVVADELVRIGDDTLIGEYVSIRDANHGTAGGEPMRLQPQTSAPVHIGRDVWIGRGACVLPGVQVGDGAIVAANSVVTRDVAPMTIVGGVPARPLRDRVSPAGGDTATSDAADATDAPLTAPAE